jgi:hypothetical protein
MSAPEGYQWRRDKDGLGVCEHRGKVAVAGVGHFPVDRRWDGVAMDKTLGAYSILACQKATDEAGAAPGPHGGTVDRAEETLLLHPEQRIQWRARLRSRGSDPLAHRQVENLPGI